MPYHSLSGTATDAADFFTILQNFLVASGYTLHDDQTALATPYFVVFSPGESGREDIYLQFIYYNTTQIRVTANQYWNAQTHTGVNPAYYATYCYIRVRDTPFLFWLYADLDHLFPVTKDGATYYGFYAGILKRYWSGQIGVTQAAVNAGSEITLALDDVSFLVPDRDYIIKDDANIHRVRITTVDSAGQTIKLAVLPTNMTAGAKIGEDPQPVIISRYNAPGDFYALNRFDGYQSATTQNGICRAGDGGSAEYAAGDARYGLTTLFPWFACHSTNTFKELRGQLIEVFQIGQGDLDSEYLLNVGLDQYRVFDLNGAGWCAVREVTGV